MSSRKHHYLVAHKVIPRLFFNDPIRFLTTINEEGEEFFKRIWNYTGEKYVENNEDRLPPNDLSVLPFNKDQIYGALFKFPSAELIPEAHMSCALGKLQKDESGVEKLENCHYLTLELGQDIYGSPKTVLCGWDKDDRHLNYGDGPENKVEEFLKKCLSMI